MYLLSKTSNLLTELNTKNRNKSKYVITKLSISPLKNQTERELEYILGTLYELYFYYNEIHSK